MERVTLVTVKLLHEGLHFWPEANTVKPDVGFLAFKHRHIFHIECAKRVYHSNRQIEVITFKHEVEAFLKNFSHDFDSMSCEDIAQLLFERFGLYRCSVTEDGENGAEVFCI